MEQNDLQLTEEERDNYTNKLELEDGAYMTFPDFTHLIARKLLEAEVEDQIKQLFKIFDHETKGYITAEDIKKVLVNLNSKITDEDVDDILREADNNQDGVLDYEQFLYMCLPK